MSNDLEELGCIVLDNEDVKIILIKKTDCSMREAMYKSIHLIEKNI